MLELSSGNKVTKQFCCFHLVEPTQHTRLINCWCLFYDGSSQLPKRYTFSNINKTMSSRAHIYWTFS
jgi:hypothetical protein